LAAGFGFGRGLAAGLVPPVGLVDVPPPSLDLVGDGVGVLLPAPRRPHSSGPSLQSVAPAVTALGSADAGPVPAAKNTRAPADSVADAAPTRHRSRLMAISLPFDVSY
jgi:hypothetical protein